MGTPAISTEKLSRLTNQAKIIELLNTDRLGDKVFCDATIKAEENIYSVHTLVLGSVSEYFKNLFNNQMKEGYTKEAVTDMPAERLELVLEFVYCGGVEISNDNVLNLLDAAEYTQIHGLKLACSTFLLKSVQVKNCLKLRSYAKRYNLDKVLEKIYETIGDTFAAVVKLNDFLQLGIADIREITQEKCVKYQSEAVFTGIIAWINHDSIGRNDLFVDLFNQLDLTMMSTEFLMKNVITEKLVCENATCASSVMVAFAQSKPAKQSKVDQDPTSVWDHLMILGLQIGSYIYKIDAITRKATKFPSPIRAGANSTLVLMGSKLFRVGGDDKTFEIFDQDKCSKWKYSYDMPGRCPFAAATTLDGCVYVSGGKIPKIQGSSPNRLGNTQEALATCFVYNGYKERWSQIANMDTPRSRHAMIAFKGELWCFGGLKGGDTSEAISSCEKYTNYAWRPIANMNDKRYGLAVAEVNGFIFAIGGGCETVERYDPVTNRWLRRQPLQYVRTDHAACTFNGKIYVFGGTDYHNSAEVYDPDQDTWSTCFEMKILLTKTVMFAV